MTYRTMMDRVARVRGRHPLLIELPFLTPHLSPLWLYLVTPAWRLRGPSSRGCASLPSHTTIESGTSSGSNDATFDEAILSALREHR
jgi:hypothetical protein